MKKLFFITISSLLITCCNNPVKYDLIIQNASLFNGNEDLGIVNIGINQDTIAIITTEELVSDSIYDASGKFIIPGLVNSHVHITDSEQLKTGYDNGILAFMNMHSSDLQRDSTLREQSKKQGYSYYYSAGIGATVPGGHPSQLSNPIETINDSVSVQQWLNNRLQENPDYIKIFRDSRALRTQQPTLPFDSIQKLISYAKEKDKMAVIHTSNMNEIRTIARFKPNGFVHGMVEKDSIFNTKDLANLKANNSFIVPTNILVMKPWEFMKPRMRGYEQLIEFAQTPENMYENIRVLHSEGIMIVAGTDAGARPYINYGDDLIYELNIYSKAGLSNLEVLKTATGNASLAWKIPIGKLEVGSKLNMLLLNANPLEDLGNLKKIEYIWKSN